MAEKIHIIDEGGDVLLKVGKSVLMLKVSSAVLSRVSPVFRALFGPHFSEGQAKRTAQDPVTISFPDDQFAFMRRLCELAHLSDVPVTITGGDGTPSEKLLGFATTVDKYDLASRLNLQCQAMLFHWLRTDGKSSSMSSVVIMNIIAASYILKQHEAFDVATMLFMQRMYARTSPLLSSKCGQKLPVEVLFALQERRDRNAGKGICLQCVLEKANIYDVCTKHKV